MDSLKENVQDDRYVIYRIGTERVASPLLTVREIVDPLPYTDVPNPHPSFRGIANLRGQVIGIIDIGYCFGFPASRSDKDGKLLIFEVADSAIAGFVQDVEAVSSIDLENFVAEPSADMPIPRRALDGMIRYGEKILPIVNLLELVQAELGIARQES